MRKIVYNALYCSENNILSPNTKIRGGVVNYTKQSFVSLKSTKISNPGVDVYLVTNQQLPKQYMTLFSESDIKVIIVPFDDFIVPEKWRWAYAFYKLHILYFMSHGFDNCFMLGLDTDTYVPLSLSGFWDECGADRPILLPMPFDSQENGRKQINKDYQKIFNLSEYPHIVQWGGEFLGGSSVALRSLSEKIKEIYNSIKDSGFQIDDGHGDEAIISMAADRLKCVPAVPYVRRYWSRRKWYEVDSAWFYVPVWHLPSEKNYGFNIMFSKLEKEKHISLCQAAHIFNLPVQHKYSVRMLKYYLYNILYR